MVPIFYASYYLPAQFLKKEDYSSSRGRPSSRPSLSFADYGPNIVRQGASLCKEKNGLCCQPSHGNFSCSF
ncbi:hypothetical protein OIU77_011667 [Salix suchowensis]|uniref:Uncharacterized protein n=1 Tax=Salix suchowensis TaxID=1278906 RepID=A0ABQ9A182_9ROSI|nr:hypothetical protein OIU77_011667 [Salix suchowensis]